ncbi:hypothetical protein [Streptomyces sp. NRRL S-244]|uniref:hypothetical protein n=1 Tax=Streptomyces sp. NRRL S-244 TaxID=1463897 RepID=UPI000B30D77A|nr:hypothetical protein [Streptomyces sp. NRRL S-244]
MTTHFLGRGALLLPVLALGLASAPAPAAADGSTRQGPGRLPAAHARTADDRQTRIEEILEYCGSKRNACSFQIDTARTREYATAVTSLGNAVVNCTTDPMTVDRTVTLRTSSSDNIGGEISGRATVEGTVTATGEVTANLADESSNGHKTPFLNTGPTSEKGTRNTVSSGSKETGSTSAKQAFETAFKATYARSWTTDNTETTTYRTTVKPYDMLVFAASAAMRRVVGSLVTDQGKKITDVAVDSPSMINTSRFIAQTYAVPDNLCGRKRPGGDTAPDEDNAHPVHGTRRSR